mmetsp:Transcript_20216/g.56778  ORF Transcript_20216/g.56778 Transcript_20216/m.56778 type:complete len:148 (+) Transcript_20216:84-527(+)
MMSPAMAALAFRALLGLQVTSGLSVGGGAAGLHNDVMNATNAATSVRRKTCCCYTRPPLTDRVLCNMFTEKDMVNKDRDKVCPIAWYYILCFSDRTPKRADWPLTRFLGHTPVENDEEGCNLAAAKAAKAASGGKDRRNGHKDHVGN